MAAAIALSGWVGATLLAVILWRRRGWLRIEVAAWRRLPRILLATWSSSGGVHRSTGGDALLTSVLDVSGFSLARTATLGVLVAAGLGVYALCLQAFGVTSVRALHQAIRERF